MKKALKERLASISPDRKSSIELNNDQTTDNKKQASNNSSIDKKSSYTKSVKSQNNGNLILKPFKERVSILLGNSQSDSPNFNKDPSKKNEIKGDFTITLQQLKDQYSEYQQSEVQKKRDIVDKQVSIDQQLQEVKKGLRQIFDKHSASNSSYGFLKLSQFKDILSQANLWPQRLSQEQVEIIYYQNKKKGDACLVLESFMRALLTIAKTLVPDMDPMESMLRFYKGYFIASQVGNNQASQQQFDYNQLLWEKDVRLMRSLGPRFAKIYPFYWKNELVIKKVKSKFENEQDSLKELQRFVRDFNLVFLLQAKNLQTFNRIWEESLNQETEFLGVDVQVLEQGHTFKFTNFINFLIKCAHTYYPTNGLSELLEKLEFSKGTEWIRSEGVRISFINHYDVTIEDDNVLGENAKKNLKFLPGNQGQNNQLNSSMINSREFALKLNKYVGYLEKIYQQYAVEASSKVGMNSFVRFLKEYELMAQNNDIVELGQIKLNKKGTLEDYQKVSINRAQIIFKQTTRSKHAKLNFEQFLYALKQLSNEVYPFSGQKESDAQSLEHTLNEVQQHENMAFFKMISHNIIKKTPIKINKYEVYKRSFNDEEAEDEQHSTIAESRIKDMIDAMQDEDIQELVKIFYSQIHPLMKQFQSTLEGLLDFEATVRFCQTYDIFPPLVSKARLKELFTVFASFREQSLISKVGKRQKGEEGKRYIDIDLMIELLTTVALSQKTLSSVNQSNQYEGYFIKILFLIEKVHFSEGLKRFRHKYQKNIDILLQIEKAFPKKFKNQKREYEELLYESGSQGKSKQATLGKMRTARDILGRTMTDAEDDEAYFLLK